MSDSTESDHLDFHDAGSYIWRLNSHYDLSTDTHKPEIVVIDRLHQLVHEGRIFQLSGEFTLAAAGTAYFLGITDSSIVHFTAGEITSTGTPINIIFYEDATVSANGTQVFGLNKNRNSVATPTLLTYSGPTVTGVGTPMEYGMVTTAPGNAGGDASLFSSEFILDNASNYLISITNNDSQTATIDYNFLWYEV